MLSGAELDACGVLLDELSAFAIERIPAERPRPDQIATKASAADWVTETDLAVERHVRAAVLERFPGHRVVGEEYGQSGADEPGATWYVDPVDGTTNFVHGLPWSSFSLVVADEEGAAAGVVADPYRREALTAIRGRGAHAGGTPLRCAGAETLTGGIVLTELLGQALWPATGALMAALAGRGCVTRIMGSNALSLASVGAGRALGTAIGALGPVDCLAGILIAREAGASVTTTAGSEALVEGEPVLCAAPGVADELRAILEAVDGGR